MSRAPRVVVVDGGRWLAPLLALAAAACRSAEGDGLPGLAERPPVACSVLVGGGAFVQQAASGAERDSTRPTTFGGDVGLEAITLAQLRDVLDRGRVFAATAADGSGREARWKVAAATTEQWATDPDLDRLLRRAAADGHDVVLVLEGVRDGAIDALGINGQWPITLATWLLAGLGALIPDHSYQARASLRATLRDVHTGRVVEELVVAGGPIDLSLLQRASMWGWMQSILVPPFWVADDDERVAAEVRGRFRERLMLALAQRLKGVDVADRLARMAPATVRVQRVAGGIAISLEASEPIAFVRVRADGDPVSGPDFDAFHAELMRSRLPMASTAFDAVRHRAVLRLPRVPRTVQVLMQSVGGLVASRTHLIEEAR